MNKGVDEHFILRDVTLQPTEDRIKALVVDTETCFLYWREGAATRHMAERYWQDGWEARPRRLRLESGTGAPRFADCQAQAGSLYVDSLTSGAKYRVEYGVQLEERFLPLLATEVQMPGQKSGSLRASKRKHDVISSYSIYSQG